MANKLQAYAKLADHAARQITASYQEWTAFLDMAGRGYKYPLSGPPIISAPRAASAAVSLYRPWEVSQRRIVRPGCWGVLLLF